MKKTSFILFCLLLSIVSMEAGAKSVTFAFYLGSAEESVVDSIKTSYACHNSGEGLDIVPVIVKEGKLQAAVAEFSDYLTSHSSSSLQYNMIGVGIMGSAVATMCAAESSPESLVLISGLGISGRDALRRILTAGSYMANMQMGDSQNFRKQVDGTLCGTCDSIMLPSGFAELKYFVPTQYLERVKCPVLCVYGTNDSLVEWYENAKAAESALSASNHGSKVLAYMNTGYCLLSSSQSNIPHTGDINPILKNTTVNATAISNIVDWISSETK
ncbi:MAG: hypothetical protein HDS64_07185 [Bacteroidales bacterium]|nr:hypothetical protein [Bacteroidales bacterium]